MTLTQYEFYIIQAAEETNEVYNPSVETNTTGYTASGAGVSIARSATYQRRGVYSLEVTTATGVESGVYYGTVNEVSGATRYFSVDIYNPTAGQPMRIQIRDTSGNMLSEETFTSNGHWQRKTLTRVGTANTTRRLYIIRDAIASTVKFYVDGLKYSSVNGTYLDGDMKGLVPSEKHYRWLGAPHASKSWRSGQCRNGGEMLRIKDYAKILTVLGLGMAPLINIAMPVAANYSSYQTTFTDDRQFILRLGILGASPEAIQDNRQALINAVRPDAVTPKQPLVLRYQGVDDAGADASEPLDITAVYVDGLQDGPAGPSVEFANARFVAYLPLISKGGDSGVELGYQTTVSNVNDILQRGSDGVWNNMNGGLNGSVLALTVGLDGYLYAGGLFHDTGGGTLPKYIAKWDGLTWASVGTGVNLVVYALAVGPDGAIYAGGSFTSAGGNAANHIAKWDGSTWTALGTGVDNYVYALAFGPDGSLYAGGAFTNAGGVSSPYIAKWDGSAWSALGTGTEDVVRALAFLQDGSLYVGGDFTNVGDHIAKWDGSTWSALGAGVGSAVFALAIGPDGSLYAGGSFVTAGGISANKIAKWDGSTWSALGAGVNNTVNSLCFGSDGSLYAGGIFTSAGGISIPDRVAQYSNGVWSPIDVDIDNALAAIYGIVTHNDSLVIGGGGFPASTALSATITAPSIGSAVAYPVFYFTGPGTLGPIRNYTTGQAIFFNDLTLLAGETVTLDLRPGMFSFTSSFRGNLSNYIANGSNLNLSLQSGANNISAFIYGTTTAATTAKMTWVDQYWSIDGAAH